MRPQAPLGFYLTSTGHSLFKVCIGGRLSLMMCVHTYGFLCIPDYGLLVQGKTGGVGWYTW